MIINGEIKLGLMNSPCLLMSVCYNIIVPVKDINVAISIQVTRNSNLVHYDLSSLGRLNIFLCQSKFKNMNKSINFMDHAGK